MLRLHVLENLRNELKKTRNTLEERKTMDKAKGIIMDQRSCNEEEAYKTLRKLSMENNKRMVEVAEQIISITGALSS